MTRIASPENPYKRNIDAVQRVYECAKRLKTHPDSDSAPSTVSDESARIPTSVPEDTTEASDVESDTFTEASESSEEPSDESSTEGEDGDVDEEEDEHGDEDEYKHDADQDEAGVVNLRANRGQRPKFKLGDEEAEEDIRPFLKEFLPQLEAANEELEAQKKAGTLQSSEINGEATGDDEEQYIEMNLGLGVLEEKDDTAVNSSGGGSDDEQGGEEVKEKDILGKLLGREKAEDPIGIQEVPATENNT